MLFRSDRKSTRLNSSHLVISYAVFCLKKKKKKNEQHTQRKRVRAVVTAHQSTANCTTVLTSLRLPVPVVSYPAPPFLLFFFFFNDTATTEIYTLSLHDALPI